MAETQRKQALETVHPQMLRMKGEANPQRLGTAQREAASEAARREIGQALEWAIEQARAEKKAVAGDCGYTDQGVIGRWISGIERLQLDKLKAHSRTVYVELLFALLQAEEGVEVSRQVTLRRVG